MNKFFYKWQNQPSWVFNEVVSCVRLNLLQHTGTQVDAHIASKGLDFVCGYKASGFPVVLCRADLPGQLLSTHMLTAQLAHQPPFSFILRLCALFSSQLPGFIKLIQPSCYLLIWLKPNSRPESYFQGREQEVGGRYLILLVSFPW